MELTEERAGQIAILILKLTYKENQHKVGILNPIDAKNFVENIPAFCAELPKEADVKLEEYFAVMSSVIPEESRVTYDEAVKNFLEKNSATATSPEPKSKN